MYIFDLTGGDSEIEYEEVDDRYDTEMTVKVAREVIGRQLEDEVEETVHDCQNFVKEYVLNISWLGNTRVPTFEGTVGTEHVRPAARMTRIKS